MKKLTEWRKTFLLGEKINKGVGWDCSHELTHEEVFEESFQNSPIDAITLSFEILSKEGEWENVIDEYDTWLLTKIKNSKNEKGK